MPELPEVETTVRDLKMAKPPIVGAKFINVWTDFEKMIHLFLEEGKKRKVKTFEEFKKEIKGREIQRIWRRGKNICFDLSGGKILLIHQKLTGHLLLGEWERKEGKWVAKVPGPLSSDPMNKFLHLIFWLDNGKMLALSDLRKFAKVELWERERLKESKEFKSLGPEPLESSFTFKKFKECLKGKKGEIKKVLMDQTVIAGIGNIYSSEILWEARVYPFKKIPQLSEEELRRIYKAIKSVLRRAIEAKGESISDFRRISGEKGGFTSLRKVYRREGEECLRCGTLIKKLQLGGRSAYFCPKCQQP